MERMTNKVSVAARILMHYETDRRNSLSVDDQAGDSLGSDDIGRPDVFSVETLNDNASIKTPSNTFDTLD